MKMQQEQISAAFPDPNAFWGADVEYRYDDTVRDYCDYVTCKTCFYQCHNKRHLN